ncbi:hypothetical protein LBMAG21_17260 [Armatimonadota bacterium]|nr:hypothetical protein LBMAG21_17260 [Armatimonadota bacterium]
MLFTPAQERALAALCDCLIPPDNFPGAWQAGAGDYITRLLDTDCTYLQDTYRLGLESLDAEATAHHAKVFSEITGEEQTALLTHIEEGKVVANWLVSPQPTFNMWVHHVAESYYSDSGNGGNHGNRSWEMIGYEIQGEQK